MSHQDWKSKLSSRFAYSNIAFRNDNYDYFQARRDLNVQLSLLNQQGSDNVPVLGALISAKLSSMEGSPDYAASRQKLLILTQEIAATAGKILSDYLNDLQALQVSHITGSTDNAGFRAQAGQKCAAAKDLTSLELDRSMNEAMIIIEEADKSVQDSLADFFISAHDYVMAGLGQQMLDLQKKMDEFVKVYEQIHLNRATNDHSVARFTTTVMEAIRKLFNQL
jgi:hypothetical protein